MGSGLEMGETELEEGEARSSQNEPQDSTIDPDIALSYIEEKLQNVLGHFQKDFEGGVSAENLGAKFGGYGSFLPTYQRSPTLSHTKSPSEAHHNYDSSKSPQTPHVEIQKSFVSSSASPSKRPHIASGIAERLGSNLKGNNVSLQSGHVEKSNFRSADIKKTVNSSDQRTLKVRIKVGSKSLTTQKNAEIYSGLGLEVSPSSSLDNSPTTTEEQSGKLKEVPEASPTSILQIMISPPGGLLLSPLSENLICLTEKNKPGGRVETKTVNKNIIESSGMLENGSLINKCNKKKLKLSEKGGLLSLKLANQKNGNNESAQAVGGFENLSRKPGSLSNISEFKRETLVSNNAACPLVDQFESTVCKGRQCEEAAKLALEKSFTGSKKTPKVAYTIGTQGVSSAKDDMRDIQKDREKPGDRYRDFFGDIEFEDEDKESVSGEMKSPGRLNNPVVVEKRSSSDDHDMSKGKKFDINFSHKPPQVQENYTTSASQSAPPNGNGMTSEAPVGSVPLVQEDWVSCDKCEKWRLLPLGTNVSSLPDKWLCRMLTWLPGMNRCSIPQEVTTNALRALYHPTASVPGLTSETQHSQLNSNSAVNYAQMASADASYPGLENQNPVSQIAPFSGKKKHGLAKAVLLNDVDCSNSSSSFKKSLGTSAITSSMNSRKNLPSRKSGFAVEKYSDHMKEKPSLSNSSDKGTIFKIKTKREADMTGSRAFKRMKSEGLHDDDDYWTSDTGGTPLKAVRPTTSFSNGTSKIDKPKPNSHKDLSEPKSDVFPGTNAATHEKCDDRDSLRKRKAKDLSDQRKEKKTRIFNAGVKDNGNVSGTTVNPSVAANSSSSMVSSSHKNKIIGQEVKGSPVESVSSSPLRYPSAVKFVSNKDKLVRKDDFHDTGGSLTAVAIGSGMLSGEDGREMVKKENLSEQCKVEEKANTTIQSQKNRSGKGLSSHLKEMNGASGAYLHGVHNSSHDTLGRDHLYEEGLRSRKNMTVAKSGDPGKGEKFTGPKDNAGGTPIVRIKGQNQKKFAHDEKYVTKIQDKKHHIHQEHSNEKFPKRSNWAEGNGNGKSHSLLASAKISTEIVSGTQKENNDDGQSAPNHRKKYENQNGQPIRHPTPNSLKTRDIDVPSPVQRDLSNHVANSALKEAKGLKHLADRLKNSGSTESIGLYFQASLKFLHGAFLLETGSSEATEQNDLMHSMHVYSSTAKLCEFCAREYEKLNDMAAAALAYKCMEVAYLRVVYSSHNSASKDRNELQTALQIAPPGESPSSSASDVDNLNHQATTDKATLAKVVGSAQASGSHILTAQNRSGFLRILKFAQDVNFAMEASRRSRIAFAAATAKHVEISDKECIDSFKRALDFSFQDVEGLLCLLRSAMEVINR
ncbi:CW-type Zinc Finger [Striga hermonthica]|uniref:CW-type Zinc Finger n=1 Tax=Striga hermonthica TaxID=68872 RepID=A0A9N7RJH2_STRHE|nr:CW-type Zinc Finger [Striga hermonthica]